MKDQHKEKELIQRMLSGQLSPEEQQEVNRMMKESFFQDLFHQVLDEQGGELELNENVHSLFADARLEQFYDRLAKEEQTNSADEIPVVQITKPLWKRVLPYAAAIIIAITSLVAWFAQPAGKTGAPIAQQENKKNRYPIPVEPEIQYTEQYNPRKKRLKVKLADGSVVTLGGKSRLRYPSTFSENKRDIYLEGEAFFEVKKDPQRPFTVYTGDVHTQVLGTSFKVSAQRGAPVEVAVVTGKVRVSYHANNMMTDLATMLPGDKISWNNNHLSKARIDTKDILAWKQELMVFRKQSLKNILDVIKQHYGVNITVVNKGFLTEKISLSLEESMPLEKAMNVLAVTAGFEHTIDSLSRTVTIK